MISDDREVFAHIKSGDATSIEIDFLTYSIYSFEKYQWMEQCKTQSGSYPSDTEVNAWISNITEFRYSSYREEAARLFDAAAKIYMSREIEEQRKLAVRESILSEIRAAGSFWRQTGIALITAILAPLIIGAMLVAALSYDRLMFSATDVGRWLRPAQTAEPH